MTEFHVEVVRIGAVEKHPNADALSLTKIHGGYPVCFRTGDYREGDLAVYVPVDSVVPECEAWEFLGAGLRNRRIRAKKLRGIFSMGLLTAAPDWTSEGDDVAELLGIVRYEESAEDGDGGARVKVSDGLEVPPPGLQVLPPKYDLEPFRKYGAKTFTEAELVVVTEKIDGQNFKAVHDGEALHVGSRTRWVDPRSEHFAAKVGRRYGLATKLSECQGIVIFGESYGNVGGRRYGVDLATTGDALVVFDAFAVNRGPRGVWLDFDELTDLCRRLDLPMAPTLAVGLFGTLEPTLAQLAEGATTLGAEHVREGWVIKPAVERWDPRIGRVILKMHGEGYLTRKGS